MYRKNRKYFHLLTLCVMTIMIILCFFVKIVITRLNEGVINTYDNVKSDISDTIQNDLNSYSSLVESYISSSNNINEDFIKQAFSNNLDSIKNTKYINKLYFVNLGLTVDLNATESINSTINDYNFSDREFISTELNKLLYTLQNTDDGHICKDFDTIIKDAIFNISNKIGVDYNEVRSMVYNVLFTKNNTVMMVEKTNIDDFKTGVIRNGENITDILNNADNDDVWIEWITIPKGFLGLNNEPAITNGINNINYKKFAVVAIIDKDSAFKNLQTLSTGVKSINYILITILIICVILAISLFTLLFYMYISGGEKVEPIVNFTRKNTDDNDDDSYRVYCCLEQCIKQILHRQDKL